LVKIDPRYFRPTEVDSLLGDPAKAHDILGWRHQTSFAQLVSEMLDADLKNVAEEQRSGHE
ncbi:MAG: GDP-mannose 4,6-dehydratase, partial [Rhodospirillaceae bacterium]|nr:GDP-mannose 4,6-dehydratase [Rhodospirillaceae bacterium]